MVFLNPYASTLKVWKVFCLGEYFLLKSILTDCVGHQMGHGVQKIVLSTFLAMLIAIKVVLRRLEKHKIS